MGNPAWLQGQELINLRKLHGYQRILYCGDGANDACPALSLTSRDVLLARRNGSLQRLMSQHETGSPWPDGRTLKAPVHWWSTHLELAGLVQRMLS